MRFFHISDLHIGKHLHYYDLKEDQRYILSRITDAAEEQRPDAIVIAGDIYDRSVPSAEAVSLFDWFLTRLADIRPAITLLPANNKNTANFRNLIYQSRLMICKITYLTLIKFVLSQPYIRLIQNKTI